MPWVVGDIYYFDDWWMAWVVGVYTSLVIGGWHVPWVVGDIYYVGDWWTAYFGDWWMACFIPGETRIDYF